MPVLLDNMNRTLADNLRDAILNVGRGLWDVTNEPLVMGPCAQSP